MVNDEAFAIRIKKLLSFYNITAAQMADTIGVQRSSISHLLSGRNKPSLDFVVKVIQAYEEVDLYWLLNGKGSFPKIEETKPNKKVSSPSHLSDKSSEVLSIEGKSEEIEHIIIFYKDGSFKKYKAI